MTLRRTLLLSGVVSSLVYVAADVLAAIGYPDYHSFTSRVVSELMARGAPTERLVDPLFLFYDVLVLAFAAGVWSTSADRRLHATAGILSIYAALGLLGPTFFEMNLRGSGDPSHDVPHIVLTAVLVALMFAAMGFGAATRGKAFRIYTVATVVVQVAFGVLTARASAGLATGAPTPWVGLWERIDIGAFLLWMAVFAWAMLRDDRSARAARAAIPPWQAPSAPSPT